MALVIEWDDGPCQANTDEIVGELEKATLKSGTDTYQMLRMNEAPTVEVHYG